ncbi:MAG: IclR family transcriptional regulator [Candidatus Limnocylindrales bacterium]
MVHEARNQVTSRSGVERIAAALEVVAARGWVSAADLAADLGVDRSTGWRLARSLEGIGWLQQDRHTRRYRLGLRLFELGTRALDGFDVRAEARRVMAELVSATGESADLAVRDGDAAVFVDTIDGTNEVRAFTRSGQRAGLHAIAAGKVFLAHMTPTEVDTYLRGPLVAYAPATITDPATLRDVIELTRHRGWGDNRGELNPEAGGLAVPILDADGACVAALGLNVPLMRMGEENVTRLIGELLAATRRLTVN